MIVVKVFGLFFFSGVLAVGNPGTGRSQTYRQQDDGGQYQFGYDVQDPYSQQFRQETRDALGRVVGSYGLTEADGRKRIVDYVADEYGFRANVRTNEPGTSIQEPASVSVQQMDDRLPLPPVNTAPIPPNIAVSGPPSYPAQPLLPLSPQTLDDLHDENLGTAYTQNYPQVPVEQPKTPVLQNYPQVPLSLTGTPLYVTPYNLGPNYPQSSQPKHSGIGILSKNPDYYPNRSPQTNVQGLTYYPDPSVQLYSHPYNPQSGLPPNTVPFIYQTGQAKPIIGNLSPIAPESGDSSSKPNIVLQAVQIENGIQAVPVDAETGKIYTGRTGFPALDAMNKAYPDGISTSSKTFPTPFEGLGPVQNVYPGIAKPTGTSTAKEGAARPIGLDTVGEVHPSLTGVTGYGTLRNVFPSTTGSKRVGSEGSAYPTNTRIGTVQNVYPNAADSRRLGEAGQTYSGAREYTRIGTAEKIYQNFPIDSSLGSTRRTGLTATRSDYPDPTVPKFGTRLRLPQSGSYNSQYLPSEGLSRRYRHTPEGDKSEKSSEKTER